MTEMIHTVISQCELWTDNVDVSGETNVYTFSFGRELSKVAEQAAPRYGE